MLKRTIGKICCDCSGRIYCSKRGDEGVYDKKVCADVVLIMNWEGDEYPMSIIKAFAVSLMFSILLFIS